MIINMGMANLLETDDYPGMPGVLNKRGGLCNQVWEMVQVETGYCACGKFSQPINCFFCRMYELAIDRRWHRYPLAVPG